MWMSYNCKSLRYSRLWIPMNFWALPKLKVEPMGTPNQKKLGGHDDLSTCNKNIYNGVRSPSINFHEGYSFQTMSIIINWPLSLMNMVEGHKAKMSIKRIDYLKNKH